MPSTGSGNLRFLAMTAALVGALGFFVWHAAWRALSRSTDFAVVYSASRAWVRGENPYDQATLERVWIAAGGPAERRSFDRPSLYPPTTFVLLAPIAALDWPTARLIWMAVNVASLVASVVVLLRWEGLNQRPIQQAAFWTLALSLSSTHSAVSLGQLCLLPLALSLIAQSAQLRDKPVAAGLLIGFAVALKPQVGAFFYLFQIYRGRCRVFLAATACSALLTAIGACKLWHDGVAFVAPLIETTRAYSTTGFSDPSQANPFRHEMVNVQVLVHSFVSSRTMATCIAAVIVLGLLLAACPPTLARTGDASLYDTAVVAALTLLAVYHRSYDAVFLLIPAAWALARCQAAPRSKAWAAIVVLAAVATFLPPGSAMLFAWVRSGAIGPEIATTWWWRNLAMLHQAWAVLAVAAALAATRRAVK